MTTQQPSSESERLLYRVLHRANLLPYYDTFVAQGGDDVAQLCEAGEEEFLEIMALVGMAAKPLHVRRLQKALQEYVTNPALFLRPIASTTPPPPAGRGSIASTIGSAQQYVPQAVAIEGQTQKAIVIAPTTSPNSWHVSKGDMGPDSHSCSPIPTTFENEVAFGDSTPIWKAPGLLNGNSDKNSPLALDMSGSGSVSPTPSSIGDGSMAGNNNGIPQLTEAQRQSIEMAAEALVQDLPVYDMKPLNMKRDYNRELMQVITMPDDHPDKMTMLRKYAAIYGRVDSKRKNEGKMTLHEVSVNEAAAQLCRRIPALLTRRDDLYPLSRRVVRDSGYQYSKGHSRACSSIDIIINNKRAQAALGEGSPSKKMKTDPGTTTPAKQGEFELEKTSQERVNEINVELSRILDVQDKLKTRISEARSTHDWAVMDQLRHQLEQCASKQLQLRMEQSAIIGSSKTKSKSGASSPRSNKETHNGSSQRPPQHTAMSSANVNSANSSQPSRNSSAAYAQRNSATNSSSGSSTQASKISIMEEGLKIAQQYGMSDFAEELMKGMTGDSDDSELDEQAEWNREVEQDMIKQKLITPEKNSPSSETAQDLSINS